MKVEFSIYRYNPDVNDKPRMQDYTLTVEKGCDMMLLDALIQLKELIRACRSAAPAGKGFAAPMALI
ncbi:MAG: Succinate dehydrogenase iron-sulfur subunit [Sodalis sp.]|nr:MAG: Succinate dehydrogenase iron-sulfur subunit [Sodalis sp.]